MIKVYQIVHDLEGKLHVDETVTHISNFEGEKIARIRIV